jgi:hypothetical protein
MVEDNMIDHSFVYSIKEYDTLIDKSFEEYIEKYPVQNYEINNNSYFNNEDKILINKTNEYLSNIFKQNNLILENVWVQKYNYNQFHDLHIHGENVYSFVWYINCSEKSSKTIFYNPGYPYFKSHNEIEIKPKNGKLILFNGLIPHCVVNNEDNIRSVISGNLKKWQK